MRIELRCDVRIESNRKVPQTNQLSLGVLDLDEINKFCWIGMAVNMILLTLYSKMLLKNEHLHV